MRAVTSGFARPLPWADLRLQAGVGDTFQTPSWSIPVFFKRKSQQVDVQSHLRRICDLTSPNLPHVNEGRADSRQNRTIPVLLAPWEGGKVDASEYVVALTKDIGDCGISVTRLGPLRVDRIAVGFWIPKVHEEPYFFLGAKRQCSPIGAGFWSLGIETVRPLTTHEARPLMQAALQQLRPRVTETRPPSELMLSS